MAENDEFGEDYPPMDPIEYGPEKAPRLTQGAREGDFDETEPYSASVIVVNLFESREEAGIWFDELDERLESNPDSRVEIMSIPNFEPTDQWGNPMIIPPSIPAANIQFLRGFHFYEGKFHLVVEAELDDDGFSDPEAESPPDWFVVSPIPSSLH